MGSDQLKVVVEDCLTPTDLGEDFNGAINAKKAREQRLTALLKKYVTLGNTGP